MRETHRRNIEVYAPWFQDFRTHEWRAVVSPPRYDQDWGRIFADVALFRQPREVMGKPDYRFTITYHLTPTNPGQVAWKEVINEAVQHGAVKYGWLPADTTPGIPLADGFQERPERYARMISVMFFRENPVKGLESYFLEPSLNSLRPSPIYSGAR
jgi:hypothetical protein